MDELLWLINQVNRPAPTRPTRPTKPTSAGPAVNKSEPVTYVATRRKSQQP
jgi:hypothetical protein